MTIETLLDRCSTLSYGDRMRLLVEVGRQAATDPDAAATLAALSRGDVYQRMLAVQSCYGSGDSALALAAVGDPSGAVRALALAALRLIGSDEAVAATLDQLPIHRRSGALRTLLKGRRRAAIDAYLRRLGEPAGPWLPYGTAALAEALISRFVERYSRDDWARLTRHHPALAARLLRQRAESASELDKRLVYDLNHVLGLLADALPDAALELVEAMLRTTPLGWLDLQQLVRRRPNQVLELLLRVGGQVRIDWARIVRRLRGDQQRALLAAGLLTAVSGPVLRRLHPADRLALYAAAGHSWQTDEGILGADIVALLPTAERQAEARRNWALPALQTRPQARLAYASFLPWEEALAATEPLLRNPDPDLRSAALAALIGAARYDASRLPAALGLLTARKNEQDPVRQSGLNALAGLPRGRWEEAHLEQLGQIIRAALDAADCSEGTTAAAYRLVMQLIPTHFAWAAAWAATLASERGRFNWPGLDRLLNDDEAARLGPILLPVFRTWATREQEGALLGAAHAFGLRLKVVGGLLDLLETLTRSAVNQWTASSALATIWLHDRKRAERLIPQLLAKDGSWFTQPTVYQYLHRSRQDLLTPYLGQSTFKGRFSSGKTYTVLPFNSGFERWTPEQQTIFAATLQRLLQGAQHDTPTMITAINTRLRRLRQSAQHDTPTMIAAINQLAAMPAVPPDRLIKLAALSNEKLAIRDAALRALGRVDGGAGLPALLAAMEDDRARIAIYALRAALRELPMARAVALLRDIPLSKVTVAKEVMRLLGEVRSEEAYRLLLEFTGRDLHRDVRIALLRALWDWTERPETWEVLDAASRHADPAVAAGVIRTPAERMSAAAQARLARLLATLLAHPEPRVRLDVLNRLAQLPLSDSERSLVAPLFAALASALPDECAAAARAVFATAAAGDLAILRDAISRILPQRQNLQIAVGAFQAQSPLWYRAYWQVPARAFLEALRPDPMTMVLQIPLALVAYEPADLAGWMIEQAALLHADALAAAINAIGNLARWLRPADMAALEAALAASADERPRRLGLAALIAMAKIQPGWDAERRARLRSYQADPALLVASAAQWVFPPPEAAR